MTGPQRRKRMPKQDKKIRKMARTRRKTRDVDQIHEDLNDEKVHKLASQPMDYDLPGMGQFYCVHCARHFVDEFTLQAHRRSKVHKRRLKQLSETPYTQKEADAAAGLGAYKKPGHVDIKDVSVVELRNRSTMQVDKEPKEAAPPTLEDIPAPKDDKMKEDSDIK